jgi:pimeloyl-ACP methyl ester carboxylesterase
MSPWPGLASRAWVLPLQGDRETLFFYDTGAAGPAGGGAASGDPRKPLLVLIHGLGDEADSWRRLIPLLSAAGYRVIAPDLPGFGRSRAPGRINLRGHAAVMIRLLEAVGASPAYPAVLAGSSMGALIAQEAAITRPDLVEGLILLDGCFPPSRKLGGGFIFSALPFVGKRWYRAYRKNHEAAYQSLFGYYADLPGMSEEDRRFLRDRVAARVESKTQERAYFASLRSLIGAYWTRTRFFARGIQTFPGSILILWGEKDQILPPDSAARLRELRPDAGFRFIPGAGHLPHQENPGETAAAILENPPLCRSSPGPRRRETPLSGAVPEGSAESKPGGILR